MIHVSYFLRLDPYLASIENHDALATPLLHDVLKRGAHLLQSSAQFAQSIRNGTLKPEFFGMKEPVALCSTQYKYLLASCRIPALQEDLYRLYYDARYPDLLPRHAIVACRGLFYTIQVLAMDGRLVSSRTLERMLDECRKDALQKASGRTGHTLANMGFSTAADRDQWTTAYEELKQIPSIARDMSMLQSGICVLAFDDDHDGTGKFTDTHFSISDSACRLWHGSAAGSVHTANRWWDKSINWVVSKDYFGLIGEHAMVDGMPALNWCRFAFHDFEKCEGQTENETDL